jgi:hypothetical protein
MIGQTQAHCLFGAPVAKFHQKTSDYGTYMAQEAVHVFFSGGGNIDGISSSLAMVIFLDNNRLACCVISSLPL